MSGASLPWSQEQADLIFDAAAAGALPQNCGVGPLPDLATVLQWIASDPDLHKAYTIAVRLRGFALLDDMLTCAREATPGSLPEARRTLKALKRRYALCVKDKISSTFKEGYSHSASFQAMVDLLNEMASQKRMLPPEVWRQINLEVEQEIAEEDDATQGEPPQRLTGFVVRPAREFAARETDVTYTSTLAEEIATSLTSGETLASICSLEGMPSVQKALQWLRDHDEFLGLHDAARAQFAIRMEAEGGALDARHPCGALKVEALLWLAGEYRRRNGDLTVPKASRPGPEVRLMVRKVTARVRRGREEVEHGGHPLLR